MTTAPHDHTTSASMTTTQWWWALWARQRTSDSVLLLPPLRETLPVAAPLKRRMCAIPLELQRRCLFGGRKLHRTCDVIAGASVRARLPLHALQRVRGPERGATHPVQRGNSVGDELGNAAPVHEPPVAG